MKLYSHPLASYCHKVLIALYDCGLPFEAVAIDAADPASVAAITRHWPVGKMPMLEDGGVMVPESTIILEHLAIRHPEARRLLPADPEAALDVRLWERFCDCYLQAPMQAIVSDRLHGGESPKAVAAAQAMLGTAYGMLEDRMQVREWLAGGFSMADCAALPGLFYSRTLRPFEPGQTALAAYFERLIARPSVARVIDEARPWFRYYPFNEALEARFAA